VGPLGLDGAGARDEAFTGRLSDQLWLIGFRHTLLTTGARSGPSAPGRITKLAGALTISVMSHLRLL
jgi:hypothetical protein